MGRPNAGMALWVLGLANHFSHWPARRPSSRICCSGLCGQCSSRHRAQRVDVVVLELGHDGLTGIDRSAVEQTSSCIDSVMSIAMSHRKRIVRVQELQADTWRPMTKSMCSTGLSREMLPSVMLNMVIARAGA